MAEREALGYKPKERLQEHSRIRHTLKFLGLRVKRDLLIARQIITWKMRAQQKLSPACVPAESGAVLMQAEGSVVQEFYIQPNCHSTVKTVDKHF